jgi:hypothetical protein
MIEKVVLVLFVVNVVLSAAQAALHQLVTKFPGLASADSILGKVVSVIQKVVDFASANVAHKEVAAPAQAEAPKA